VANALFDKGRDAFAKASIAGASQGWLGATAKVMLVSSYNIDLVNNTFKSDIPAAQIAAVSTYLTGKTTLNNGVCDAAQTVIPGVSWGPTILYLVGFHDSGASNTSLLIWADDTASVLPALLNAGLDLTLSWDPGSNRIFKL
jgi:hypothetical protein